MSDDCATCSCGSAWFRLVPDNSPQSVAAVCLDRKGIVTGFAGKPVCIECGEDWKPPAERLSVVR